MRKGALDLATAESSTTMGLFEGAGVSASHGAVDLNRSSPPVGGRSTFLRTCRASADDGLREITKPAILRDNMIEINNTQRKEEILPLIVCSQSKSQQRQLLSRIPVSLGDPVASMLVVNVSEAGQVSFYQVPTGCVIYFSVDTTTWYRKVMASAVIDEGRISNLLL